MRVEPAGPTPRLILMTADCVGGIWTYAVELIRALAAHDVQVALATMGAPVSSQQRRDLAQCSNLRLYETQLRLEWMEEPWADVERAGEWLLSLERRLQPDLIHLNGYVHASLPWHAPVLVVAHSCVMSWWRAVKGENAPRKWNRYRRSVRAGVQAADMVAAPSHAMMAAVQEFYGPLKRPVVIPNGRSSFLFPSFSKRPYIFAAGRLWDEAKNIAQLARVASKLPWPVFVAGEKGQSSAAGGQWEALNFLGVLGSAEISVWLSRASIYVHTAFYEPFGLSVLEAAIAGCALVLADIPSLRELWNGAAIFVSPRNDDELQAALLHLIQHPGRRAALARAALRRARDYSPEIMALRYMEAYRTLLYTREETMLAG